MPVRPVIWMPVVYIAIAIVLSVQLHLSVSTSQQSFFFVHSGFGCRQRGGEGEVGCDEAGRMLAAWIAPPRTLEDVTSTF